MYISIVIPAYNEESLLTRCLSSIRKQNFSAKNYEIIVVDNNSQDNTTRVAKTFGATVAHEAKRGIIFARRTGVSLAKGDIVVGVDADCELPKHFLSSIAASFEDSRVVGLCGTVRFDDAPLPIVVGAKVISHFAHIYSHKRKKTPVCWALNFSFRKKAYEKIGGYNLCLPMVKAGFNTQGSDESDLVRRLETNGKRVLFDKNVWLKTSGRRFKNRLIYWFFVEYLFGFVLNEKMYNTFGFLLPMRSYYDRIVPSRIYGYAFQSVFLSIVLLLISPAFSSKLATIEASSQKISHNAQKEFRKMKADLTEKLNLKITPYVSSTK